MTAFTQTAVLFEQPSDDGGRLGRHIEHDIRSRDHDVMHVDSVSAAKPESKLWARRVAPFNQGDTGACTGNALVGCLATDNATGRGATGVHLDGEMVPVDEVLARDKVYALATRLDTIPGHYPEEDTGSTGNAAAKALRKLGLAQSYSWAFSINGLVHALQRGPVAVGIAWLTGCDQPDRTGLVRWKGRERGGHEIEVIGVDLTAKEAVFTQSWGEDWTKYVPEGCAGKGGYFRMPLVDLEQALDYYGDCTIPNIGQLAA